MDSRSTDTGVESVQTSAPDIAGLLSATNGIGKLGRNLNFYDFKIIVELFEAYPSGHSAK
jgi:hypothetical protein